jgi:hypothetical protein
MLDRELRTTIYIGNKKLTVQRTNNLLIKWANELKRQFSKEKVLIAKKHMKKCSTSLVIKEVQIKGGTIDISPHSSKMGIINNTNDNKCWPECGGKGTYTLLVLVSMEICTTILESSMNFPQKTEIELDIIQTYIQLLGTYPEEYVPGYNRTTGTPMFSATLFTIVKLWKTIQMLHN